MTFSWRRRPCVRPSKHGTMMACYSRWKHSLSLMRLRYRVTVGTSAAVSADEILRRAAQVYQDLTTDQIAEVETIALDRDISSMSPQPDASGSRSPRYGYPLRITQANIHRSHTGHVSIWPNTAESHSRSSPATKSCEALKAKQAHA